MGTSRHELSGLVLAGGDGTRLQEYTRALTGAPIPKQYCPIFGRRSLLETTLARIAPLVRPAHTFVVLNTAHVAIAGEQLRSVPPENVIVQPANRDTGPGLLFSLLRLVARRPLLPVAIFPSDHHVSDGAAFLAHVRRGARLLDQYPDKLILLGIAPDRAEPAYGYIQPGVPLPTAGMDAAFHVTGFWEKPSREQAIDIARRGGLWNSFVMVFRPQRVLELLERIRPSDFRLLRDLPDDPVAWARAYQTLAPWNFSSDFLAHIPQHLLTIAVNDVAWSDLGTPQAIERALAMPRRRPPRHARPVSTAA
jgi:mannose-1-phosphate guanylyltransferase